ncbi:MAG: phenylalanine--tRNA ligase subunit beta [Christensenellales bacterium]|jgi:phenylalanyl-tRNA synthetase beta chain
MKIPLKWISDFVDIDISADEYGKRMVLTGTELEGAQKQMGSVDGVVVGVINRIEKHPDADKLLVCYVDVASGEEVQIVTGADNVFEGALVPVALHGSTLYDGTKIKKGKLRGVKSNGMLCSGEELGISDDDVPGASVHGILILKEGQKGMPIGEALGMDDTVLEFDITANRPDLLSIIGMARETAAVLDVKADIPEPKKIEGSGNIEDYISVSVEDETLCPRYCARVVKSIRLAPSPVWMQRRLSAAGVRPINNIVDITNYVMLEYGQPMHAFDLDCVRGKHIRVRRAQPDETLVTLDGKKRQLTNDMLLITDAKGPIGLAGIMGGENSEITENTKEIVFESANFNGPITRQAARGMGLYTEAATRFAKGLDITLCQTALDRAIELVEMLDAGDIVAGQADTKPVLPQPKTVSARPEKINALLGSNISSDEMVSLLIRLSIDAKLSAARIECVLPSWRGDIVGEADIAEEVGRLYGYDKIEATHPSGGGRGKKTFEQKTTDEIKDIMCGFGLSECTTYSFMSPQDAERLMLSRDDRLRNAVRISNPLGEDQSLMRTSMAPSMLSVLSFNINRKNTDLALFEIGRIYIKTDETLPNEINVLSMGMSGANSNFFAIKGIVEGLFKRLGINNADYIRSDRPYLHGGRSADIILNGGIKAGELGEVHPRTAQNYGISERVVFAQLDLDIILAAARRSIKAQPLPKYPAVARDMAVTVGADERVGDMLKLISKASDMVERAGVFDVYTGKQVEEGKKSVAFSVSFRADHTLTDDEVNAEFNKIVAALEEKFDAHLRK